MKRSALHPSSALALGLLACALGWATPTTAGGGLPGAPIPVQKLYAITADGCIPAAGANVETLLKMATDPNCLVKQPGGRSAVYRIYWPSGTNATITLAAPFTIESTAHAVELAGPLLFGRTTAPYVGTTEPNVNFVVAAPFAAADACALTLKGNVRLRNIGLRGPLPNRGLCIHGSGVTQADTVLIDGSGPDFRHAIEVHTTGTASIHDSTLAHYSESAVLTQTNLGLQLADNRYLPGATNALPLRYQPTTLDASFPAPSLTSVTSNGEKLTVTGAFTPPDDRAIWAVEIVSLNDQHDIAPLGSESCPFEQTKQTFTCTVPAPHLTPTEGTALKLRIAAAVAYYEGGPSPFSTSVEGQYVPTPSIVADPPSLVDTGSGPAGGIGILAGAAPTGPGITIVAATTGGDTGTTEPAGATPPTSATDPAAPLTGATLPIPAETAAQSATLPTESTPQTPATVPPLVFAPAEAAQAPVEGGGGCSLLVRP